MMTLHELKAGLADAAGHWNEPRGILESLHHEVRPGVFIHVGLGTAGLTMRKGGDSVGIPLGELVRLAFPEPRPASPTAASPTATSKPPGPA